MVDQRLWPRTRHPEIRESIQKFLADHPSELFSEFLYYTVGEFDKALQANPSSIIAGVLRYGIGHKMLEVLLRDIAKVVNIPGRGYRRAGQRFIGGSELKPRALRS